ncbi:MAG: PQQ-like beta-propeller repeat protein [Planctomycetes bacterium]|nr:PQQ-like beta-propeller repeat protein [Planctomycetota bacterium]
MRFLAGLALAALAACSGGGDTRGRSMYDGPDVLQSADDPGANALRAEVRSLPFKHLEWEYKLTRHQIRRLTVSGTHLYVETPTNELIAIDRFVGEVKWIYRVDTDTPLDFPPVAAHGVPEMILQIEKELQAINREIEGIIKERGPCKESQEKQKERAVKREALKVAQFGDNVYFFSRQILYCLDRGSGTLRWSRRVEFVPSAQPFATQFFIFVSAADHARVYALSVRDRGQIIDFFPADVEADENHITARPVYEDPVLYFCSHDGKVYFYSVRDKKQGNPHRTLGPILAAPVIHRYKYKAREADKENPGKTKEIEREGKALFVGGMDNAFYAIDAASGQLLWRYECAGPIKTSAVAKDQTVYVKSEDGALFAFNVMPLHNAEDATSWRRNGELRWKIPLGERFLIKGATYVYVLGPQKEIYALQEATGDLAGRYKTRHLQFLVTNPADDYFYCASPNGHLFALRESKQDF